MIATREELENCIWLVKQTDAYDFAYEKAPIDEALKKFIDVAMSDEFIDDKLLQEIAFSVGEKDKTRGANLVAELVNYTYDLEKKQTPDLGYSGGPYRAEARTIYRECRFDGIEQWPKEIVKRAMPAIMPTIERSNLYYSNIFSAYISALSNKEEQLAEIEKWTTIRLHDSEAPVNSVDCQSDDMIRAISAIKHDGTKKDAQKTFEHLRQLYNKYEEQTKYNRDVSFTKPEFLLPILSTVKAEQGRLELLQEMFSGEIIAQNFKSYDFSKFIEPFNDASFKTQADAASLYPGMLSNRFSERVSESLYAITKFLRKFNDNNELENNIDSLARLTSKIDNYPMAIGFYDHLPKYSYDLYFGGTEESCKAREFQKEADEFIRMQLENKYPNLRFFMSSSDEDAGQWFYIDTSAPSKEKTKVTPEQEANIISAYKNLLQVYEKHGACHVATLSHFVRLVPEQAGNLTFDNLLGDKTVDAGVLTHSGGLDHGALMMHVLQETGALSMSAWRMLEKLSMKKPGIIYTKEVKPIYEYLVKIDKQKDYWSSEHKSKYEQAIKKLESIFPKVGFNFLPDVQFFDQMSQEVADKFDRETYHEIAQLPVFASEDYNRDRQKVFLDLVESLKLFDIDEGIEKRKESVRIMADALLSKEGNIKRVHDIMGYIKQNTDDFVNADPHKLAKLCSDLASVLERIDNSNASEIRAFSGSLARHVLQHENPEKMLNHIEDVFLRNNIPVAGKLLSVFNIMNPDGVNGFNIEGQSTISPVLKKSPKKMRDFIIASDVIKASLGSNNRSMHAYISNIERGNQLLSQINSGRPFDTLTGTEKNILATYNEHLNTLYNQTSKGKEIDFNELSGDIQQDARRMLELYSKDGQLEYNLSDRVVRMFCGLLGFNTLDQVKEHLEQTTKQADKRNRETARAGITIEEGDLVKGVEGEYFSNILQNGSLSKEFLGVNISSDATPLDTDLSKVQKKEDNIQKTVRNTAASGYGSLYFILKNGSNRFQTTRTCGKEQSESKYNPEKCELFYTGAIGTDHYGIRCGFPSSDIDYIYTESYEPRIGFEIAKNGFYIPVVDGDGRILFTEQEYDKLRSKMAGLTYYDEREFKLLPSAYSNNPEVAQQIHDAREDAMQKNSAIYKAVENALKDIGLEVRPTMDRTLSEGFVEFLNTGSTGRGTNLAGDSDFDFIMRVDRKILADPAKNARLRNALAKALGIHAGGDIRAKGVKIEGLDETVDIDISFENKSNKICYTTEMAINERLRNIEQQYPEQFQDVIANIVKAKQLLKGADVYKPRHAGQNPQGGLGGIGVENWVLQNGGSLEVAIREFYEASAGKSFSEFKKTYQIWDFGENHMSESKNFYPHDNFINNMDESGYRKMVQLVTGLHKQLEEQQTQSAQIIVSQLEQDKN